MDWKFCNRFNHAIVILHYSQRAHIIKILELHFAIGSQPSVLKQFGNSLLLMLFAVMDYVKVDTLNVFLSSSKSTV